MYFKSLIIVVHHVQNLQLTVIGVKVVREMLPGFFTVRLLAGLTNLIIMKISVGIILQMKSLQTTMPDFKALSLELNVNLWTNATRRS
jgi:hypothetical protein